MKRLFCCIGLILIIAACSKVEEGNENSTQKPETPKAEIKIDDTSADFTSEGGSEVIAFSSSGAWTAEVINSRADSWCSVNPTSGAAGDAKVTVITKANDTPDDRTATIIIKTGTASRAINVSQKQKDALTVTASKFEVTAEGGEVTIEVKANIDFEYAVDESAKDWVEYMTTRALKTSNLVFEVKENDETEKREAKIYIKSGEFSEVITIYQAGVEPTMVISQNEYVVSSDGETIAVEVASNVDVSVELPTDANWVTEIITRGVSTNTFYFDIAPSEEYDQRTAEIKFTNKVNNLSEVVKIVQTQKDAIVLAKSEYEFDINGGELDLDIQTNVDIDVTISDNACSWIYWIETRGLNTKSLHFYVSESLVDEDREGTITISGGNAMQTITVKQSGLKDILEKEHEALIAFYEATGGDNWTHNDNWCSDKPVREWYGVYCNNNGSVNSIRLYDNNLCGTIPKEISVLTQLQSLRLEFNHLTGEIPQSITTLDKLLDLDLYNNKLSGTIPQNIEDLTNLSHLNLGRNNLRGTIPNSITTLTNLESLTLIDNQLSGTIPENIDNLTNLRNLVLSDNYLSGTIPESIISLKKLYQLWLDNNQLSGSIPENIGNLINLHELYLHSNLLTGAIPESLSNLSNLEALYLNSNNLSGDIPKTFYDWNLWKSWWWESIYGNKYKFEDLILPGPNAVVECLNGKIIDFEKEYPRNKYTILLQWVHNDTFTHLILPELKSIYDLYSDKGVKIIGWTPSNFTNNSKEEAQQHIDQLGMLWDNFYLDQNGENIFGTLGYYYPGGAGDVASLTVVDSLGKIVFSDRFNTDIYSNDGYLITLLENDFKEAVIDEYETTDYSKDGEVKQLQKATKGNGIDIVLIGDAFSDRLIADGTYDKTMNSAMEKFFEEEPYKSFRDHFNVYSVTAVSKHEVYVTGSSTALNCNIIGGSHIEGDDTKVFSYGLNAISKERMDNALFITMMNSTRYAGTCVMYPPSNGDWGDGVAVTYFTTGTDEEALAQMLQHECGHGFAKLADEYGGSATVTNENKEYYNYFEIYGWWKNIDFTSDPSKVKWSHFLTDSRYANEGLGLFEGGLAYYRYGVWRPTENSIMYTNTGGFNAPSREAIYYRIHKLAYGASWEYDYEKFVEWDVKNRATTTRGVPYRLEIPKDFKPLHAPVIVNKSWYDCYATCIMQKE